MAINRTMNIIIFLILLGLVHSKSNEKLQLHRKRSAIIEKISFNTGITIAKDIMNIWNILLKNPDLSIYGTIKKTQQYMLFEQLLNVSFTIKIS